MNEDRLIKPVQLTELCARKPYYTGLECHTKQNALPNLYQHGNETNPRSKSPVSD